MPIEICTPSELGPGEVAAWRELQSSCHELANPFCSATFSRVVGQLDRDARVAVLSDGQRLVGFLPFHRTRSGIGRGLAHGVAGCQGLVAAAGAELDHRQLLRRARLAVLELDHLVVPSGLAMPPPARVATTSLIDAANGYEAWYQDGMKRHKKYFNWLRRKRQRIESDLGPIEFDFGGGGPEVLRKVVEWKSAQYRRSGWPDPFAKPWVRELVARLAASDEPDCTGVCSSLRVGDHLLAVDFSLRSTSVYGGWFVTYNVAYGQFSPGAVRWLYTVQACAERAVATIDLGCGDEEYKQKLASCHGEVLEGHLHRLTPRAMARCTARAPRTAARRFVVEHPQLRAAVRTSLRRFGALRARQGPGGGVAHEPGRVAVERSGLAAP